MAVIGTFGVTLVMSQEYMPGRVGMASGLSIGLAIGLGGVAAVALGAVADVLDLEAAVLATISRPGALHLPHAHAPGTAYAAHHGLGSGRGPDLMPETAREFFEHLATRTEGGSERTRGLTATYRFDVGDAGSWRVAVNDGHVAVSEGDGAADCVISAPEEALPPHRPRGAEPDGRLPHGEDPGRGRRRAGDAPKDLLG